jgi:hypothetical protein
LQDCDFVRAGISRESEWGRKFDQFGHRLSVAFVCTFFEKVSQTIMVLLLGSGYQEKPRHLQLL